MHNIRDILHMKGTAVWSAAPDETVLDAIRRMAEHGVGALLVMKDDQLVGLFSERDYSRKVILRGLRSRDTPVGNGHERAGAHDLTRRHGPAGPVNHDREVHPPPAGNRRLRRDRCDLDRDLVKAVIEDQAALIEQLERYITG